MKLVRTAVTLALLALAVACTSRGAVPPTAPVDLAVADVGDGGIVTGIMPPQKRPPQARCTARLVAGTLEKADTCRVATKIVEGPGTLTYPCGGAGAAEARFGDERLVGAVHDGYLRLELTTTPDWGDSCSWQSHQLIEGHITDLHVAWKYDETLVDASPGTCARPCDATTTIAVELDD